MKTNILLLAIALFISCNQTEKLYIRTYTTITEDGKQVTTDTVSAVNGDYFDIDLNSVNNGEHYIGSKNIESPTSMENFRLIRVAVTDDKGDVLKFKSTTDFMNFMSVRGFEMKDQKDKRYGTAYTFKKK